VNVAAVIIDENEIIKSQLTDLILSYCPFISLKELAKDSLFVHRSKLSFIPNILFVSQNSLSMAMTETLSKYEDLNSVIILDKEKPSFGLLNKLNAKSYITLPMRAEQVLFAINQTLGNWRESNPSKPSSKQIGIPMVDGLELVEIDKIIRCYSISSCTRIVVQDADKDLLSSYNIGVFKKLLCQYNFFSPHKSHLINLDHVVRYKKEGIIIMHGCPDSVPVARSKRQIFLDSIVKVG